MQHCGDFLKFCPIWGGLWADSLRPLEMRTLVVCSGTDPARDKGPPEGLHPLFVLRWERNWRGDPALTWQSCRCDKLVGSKEPTKGWAFSQGTLVKYLYGLPLGWSCTGEGECTACDPLLIIKCLQIDSHLYVPSFVCSFWSTKIVFVFIVISYPHDWSKDNVLDWRWSVRISAGSPDILTGFSWYPAVSPDKFRDSASVIPQLLPSKYFLIHQSSLHPLLHSLDTGSADD